MDIQRFDAQMTAFFDAAIASAAAFLTEKGADDDELDELVRWYREMLEAQRVEALVRFRRFMLEPGAPTLRLQ